MQSIVYVGKPVATALRRGFKIMQGFDLVIAVI